MSTPVVDAQPFVAAIAAALAADGVLFGDGKKPAGVGARPYVVGFFDPGAVSSRSMQSWDGWDLTATFHCAGLSPESVRFAVRKLRGAVLGLHNQTIAGRHVRVPPPNTVPPPMSRDDDADPPLFIQIDEWRFRTSPA